MFKPTRGPKEGRSPPGLLYTGPASGSRPRVSQRFTTIGLIVTVCLLLGYIVLGSEGPSTSTPSVSIPVANSEGGVGGAILNENKFNPPAADVNVHDIHAQNQDATEKSKFESLKHGQQSHDQYANDGPRNYNMKPLKKPLQDVYKEPSNQPSLDQIQKNKQEAEKEAQRPQGWGAHNSGNSKHYKWTPAPAREKWSERPQFEQALATVVSLLPDEVHMRELIREVESTGKERMREMGLRTRAFRKYFDAWETLHMSTDEEGNTFVRDDVIQYLRSHQDMNGPEFGDEGVGEMNVAQTIRAYESYRVFLDKFSSMLFPWTMPYFSDHMSLHASIKKGGRGIVLTAGDDQAPYLLTTIWSFRQLGCTLPIEVMYLGDQDLGEDYRQELEALPGVVTRDMAQMTNDEGWRLAGWAGKPFAILLSSFREAIFIDADSLFFVDPEILFDDPGYKEHGALFFKDRKIMPENKKRWLQQVLPKPISRLAKESRMWTGESGHMQESGVVVVDKWRHFVAMLLITRYNGPDRDGNKEKGITGVYDMMYGDKETFWLGFLLAGDEHYSFHEGDAGIMGEMEEKTPELRKRDDDMQEPPQDSPEQIDLEISRDHDDRIASILASQEVVEEEQEPWRTKNWTMCAPQLLHLDLQGKPLWFNGWLLHNKFAEKSKKRFAKFKSYLQEPRDVREPGAWQLAESNMCCLTTDEDKKFDFSPREMELLSMIMKRAEEMGMGDQQ